MTDHTKALLEALRRYHDEAESEHYKGDGCWCDDLLRQAEASLAEPVTRPLKNGDIFDIGQTVNGQSKFVMFDASKPEVRYLYDLDRRYEYGAKQLIAPDRWTGEQTYRIVGFITIDTPETEASGGA
jgi:hypothetical protein